MIDHNISLIVKTELERDVLKNWFQAVRDNAPSGLTKTVLIDGKPVTIVKSKMPKSVRYAIPLTRDLTDPEVENVVKHFAASTTFDFEIYATATADNYAPEATIKIDYNPLIDLCTKWAKTKHEDWMKGKINSGWRYGMTMSETNKTHPLLRSWEELPDHYRKVDFSQAEELLALLHKSGYIMIAKEELDKLLGR